MSVVGDTGPLGVRMRVITGDDPVFFEGLQEKRS